MTQRRDAEWAAEPVAGPYAGSGAVAGGAIQVARAGKAAARRTTGPAGDSPRNQGVPGAPGPTGSADDRRASIARRLTDRDREILRAVARHRVLTTDHITAAFFPSAKRGWSRLAELHRWELLARFQPFREGWGSAPLHYVVGRTGAAVLAAEAGEDPARAARTWRVDRATALAHRRSLGHIVGLSGVWSALAGAQRRQPQECRLVRWMTEGELSREWPAAPVRPDAYLEWEDAGGTIDAFLEYDRGTEARRVLVDKLRGYERLEVERGRTSWVLLLFLSSGREASVRRALAGATVPVATAVLAEGVGPHGPIWLPMSREAARVRLSGLANESKPSQALQRAASGSPRAWRFETPIGEEAPIDP